MKWWETCNLVHWYHKCAYIASYTSATDFIYNDYNNAHACECFNAVLCVTNYSFVLYTAIICRTLPDIPNGFITYAPDTTPDYDLNTVATYACDPGFVLDLSLGGSVTRTCVDDMDNGAEGVFDSQTPRCVRKSLLKFKMRISVFSVSDL